MDTESFKSALLQGGYDDIEIRSMAANLFNEQHTHDFDVRALMLEGELKLSWSGKNHTYRSGEIFVMEAGCPHIEQCGPVGARYLVGRRHPAV